MRDGRVDLFTTMTGLSNDTVFSILENRTGSIWFGTDSGLTRLKNGRFEIAFSVAPRFHETLWFRGTVVLSLLLAGPLFYRVRIRLLTRQKAELERIIAERTSEVNAANARLAQLAREDGLTGLLNRRAFDAALDEECRRASRSKTPLSLVLLDVDCFKAYNDLYGHPAGDACLRTVSGAVASAHRRAGELVARYGGEELAVILPGLTAEGAASVTASVRLRVCELAIPHAGSTVAPFVTVSAGVACSKPGCEISPDALVVEADRALYDAKERGSNRVEIGVDPGLS